MSERNHVAQGSSSPAKKSKLSMIVAGTAVAVLTGGVLFQVYRADTAPAGEGPQAGGEAAGRAQLNGSGSAVSGTSVARVTDGERVHQISQDELAHECIQRVGKDVLDSMINRTIIQLACEKQGIVISEAEVTQEVVRIAGEFKIPVDTWYQMLQAERNLNPVQYRRDVIWPMLALRKLAGEQVSISEQDIQKAFVRHYGARVKARMILLDNLRRAQGVWEEAAKNPEEFERLARKHSVDPNSAALGGSIHPIPRFSGNDELENAAFKLKPGEVSGIIQISTAPTRYAILKSEGLTEQVVTNLESVRELIITDLEKEQTQEKVAKIFEQLRGQSRVDNYLTNTSTGGVRQTAATSLPGQVVPAAASRQARTRAGAARQSATQPR